MVWVCLAAVGVWLALAIRPAGAAASAASCPSHPDAYSQAVLADAPIAYYRLDESAGPTMCDSSTSANDGTYNSAGITYGVPGALVGGDTGISADGTSGVVGQSGSASGITGHGSFTLEAWFKNTEATPANHVLVDIGQTCSDMVSAGSCNGVTINDGSIAGLALYPNNNQQLGWGPASGFGIDAQGSSVIWDPTTVGVNLWDGSWHYLAVTVSYDATDNTDQITGYVDGHDLGAPTRDPYDSNQVYDISPAPVALGQWPTTGYFLPLVGGLDDVAVYPTALSPQQIAAHWAAASEQLLTVATVGQGTVTSNPAGIDCGATASQCTEGLASDSQVTLTATALPGSIFAGWSGGGCSGTGPCTLTLTSSQAVTAHFSGGETLTVSSAGTASGTVTGTGISCPTTCSATYAPGTQVTLAASPGPGATFAGWTGGGCSGAGTCTVTMSSNESVIATFNSLPQKVLGVSLAGTGSGTVTGSEISCPGPCSASYTEGTQVTLTATPGSGSTFAGWSGGGCSGTSVSCTVTLSASLSVTAIFDMPVFTPPSAGLRVLLQQHGTGGEVLLPSGNLGLPVNTTGSCELSLQELPAVHGALAASASKRRVRRRRLGLIKPFRETVASAGLHLLPLIPTRKEIALYRRRHRRRAHLAAAAGGPLDPVAVSCKPLTFTDASASPSQPIIDDGASINPSPPPGFAVLLGGLDSDGYCRSIGLAHSQLNGPVVGPDATLAWVCVSSSGQQVAFDFQAACRYQYPGYDVVYVADRNNAYSGQCWARGTPTGSGTTTITNVAPPPPPAPPLSGCFHSTEVGLGDHSRISLCVADNQVTALSVTVDRFAPDPPVVQCFQSASIPHALPLLPGGFFRFSNGLPGSRFLSIGGQVAGPTGGNVDVIIGTCLGESFNFVPGGG
ncbi:MAG TPA: LamG-like jellyroll fold domain-containing protein [Solirubrobacteraceae bacterium]|nr:LamG-like jellyroll fold domain-containing protein [Solirubrobacteraceae bacterium]